MKVEVFYDNVVRMVFVIMMGFVKNDEWNVIKMKCFVIKMVLIVVSCYDKYILFIDMSIVF